MMHYRKGENVEKEITKDDLPFADCMPTAANGQKQDFLWMHVKGGTKVSNVISYAKKALDDRTHRTVVWSGSGGGVVKTISCAEILKRDYPLYQVTRMCYTLVDEYWVPQMKGLDELVVHRKIPCLHILMSLDNINDSIAGLQKPNTTTDYWIDPKIVKGSADNNAQRRRPQQQQQHSGQNPRQRYGARSKHQQQQQQHQQQQQQSQPKEEVQQEQEKRPQQEQPTTHGKQHQHRQSDTGAIKKTKYRNKSGESKQRSKMTKDTQQ